MAERPPFRAAPSYNTPLSPLEELLFRDWIAKNDVPFNADASGASDYDMRGYFRGMQSGQPMARPTEVNPNDNRPHFTDYYKTPLHHTFSSESQWAGKDAPSWINDHQLATQGGRIVFDERASSTPLERLMAR